MNGLRWLREQNKFVENMGKREAIQKNDKKVRSCGKMDKRTELIKNLMSYRESGNE